MFIICPITPEETTIAKRLIYIVAREVFDDPCPLAEALAYYEGRGAWRDRDDIQANYSNKSGTFRVMTKDERIIGTGAFPRYDDDIYEMKRVWFLSAYQGQGLGYHKLQELFAHARARGYHDMRLETERRAQARVYELYRRLGFFEILSYSQHTNETAYGNGIVSL